LAFSLDKQILFGRQCTVFIALRSSLDFHKPISTVISTNIKHFPFAILGLSFCLFVFFNGGIVLGDRLAHKPVFHIPQVLYFLSFTAISSTPLFISKHHRWIHSNPIRSAIKYKWTSLGLLVSLIFSVNAYTYSHAYLLADNRHFTFYLWRWWFQRHWSLKYFNIPFYLIFFWFVFDSMSISKFFKIVFLISSSLCIIPAELLEFRYFIIPYVIWRLTVLEKRSIVLCELLFSCVINIFALYLFFERPFYWINERKVVQHFMW